MRVCSALSAWYVAGALAASALAESPLGEYSIEVSGEAGVALPVGVSEWCETTPDGEICVSSDVMTDSSGAVTGTGNLSIEGGLIDLDLAITGQVAGSTLKPKTLLSFTAEGSAIGFDATGSGRMRCALSPMTPEQELCKGKARLCIYADGELLDCGKVPFVTVLNVEHVEFEIALDNVVTTEKNAVTGDATVALDLPGVSPLAYTAKGRYSPKADTSSLKLQSVDPAHKTSLALKRLELEALGAASGSLAFKIAGQKGKAELPVIPP